MDSITAMATAWATEKIEQQQTTEMLETVVSKHVAADCERREQAERDREHARRVRAESRREAFERRVAELGRGGAEESRGYGLGD